MTSPKPPPGIFGKIDKKLLSRRRPLLNAARVTKEPTVRLYQDIPSWLVKELVPGGRQPSKPRK